MVLSTAIWSVAETLEKPQSQSDCPHVEDQSPIVKHLAAVGHHTQHLSALSNSCPLPFKCMANVGLQLLFATLKLYIFRLFTWIKLNYFYKLYLEQGSTAERRSWEIYSKIKPAKLICGPKWTTQYNKYLLNLKWILFGPGCTSPV